MHAPSRGRSNCPPRAGYAAVAGRTREVDRPGFKEFTGFGRYHEMTAEAEGSPPPRGWVEDHFRAMGSHAHLVLRGTPDDARWARHELERLGYRWSRGYGCSNVARANRAAGRAEVAVCTETLDLLDAAIAWWRATDGWFDPTVPYAPESP